MRFMVVLIMALFASAAELQWVKGYDQALAIAKAEGKGVMVVMTTKACPWCQKLKRETLKHPRIMAKIASGFIATEIDRDEDSYPKQLHTKLVPTTFFLSNSATPLIRPVIGYWDVENFESYVDDALKAKR
ncbi:MAG: thioredoxin family protein [Campylobacterales bacterium]